MMEARRYTKETLLETAVEAAFTPRISMSSQDRRKGDPARGSFAEPAHFGTSGDRSGATRPPPSSVRAIGGRLLLADDEAPLLRGLKRLLGLATPQWRVTTALNAEQALAALEQEAFDVLVTDLEMPGMGGLALLEAVARAYPEVVLVVHSSHSCARAEELAHFVLGKPVNTDVLISTLSSAFAASLERQSNGAGRGSQAG